MSLQSSSSGKASAGPAPYSHLNSLLSSGTPRLGPKEKWQMLQCSNLASLYPSTPSATISLPLEKRVMSVYLHLEAIHQQAQFCAASHLIDDSAGKFLERTLSLLPKSISNKIYAEIWFLAGCPMESLDYGRSHILESSDRLKAAVANTALFIFTQFPPEQQRHMEYKVWEQAGSPNTGNPLWAMQRIRTKADPSGLLNVMHSEFGNLTPEAFTILNEWAAQGAPGEKRNEARERILSCLGKPETKELDLSGLNLKGLPDVFDHLRELDSLDLSGNQFEAVPQEVDALFTTYVSLVSRQDLEGPSSKSEEVLGAWEEVEVKEGIEEQLAAIALDKEQRRSAQPAFLQGVVRQSVETVQRTAQFLNFFSKS